MGVAFLFVPISCFLYTRNNRLDLDECLGAAISLSAYFATFTFMAIAFLILLGRKINKTIITISTITVIIFPLPLWLSIISGKATLIDTVMTASYSYFAIIIILLAIHILINHHKALKNIENYYSDDIKVCINWISKSIMLLVGLSITCIIAPVFSLCPYWLRFTFLTYGVLCYIHIHYGYHKMQFNIMEQFIVKNQSISNLIEVEQSKNIKTTLNSDIVSTIECGINLWVARKLYVQKSITINTVAQEINSNRTYISKYINTTYNCSFKSWITKLRLEEAKRLLIDDLEMPISTIANSIGFASVESFSHIFTRNEGHAPSKWREEHSAKPNT